MKVAEWQKRLGDNFSVNGTVGGNLLEILDLERACGQHFTQTCHGQDVLMHSFQGFYIETIENARDWIAEHGWPKDYPNYALTLLYYVITFRSFRSCEILLLNGYPLDGYGLLRDLKDRAIFLAAIAHNVTTLPLILGYGGSGSLKDYGDWKRRTKERQKEKARVTNRMIRKDSGLPGEVIKVLGKWEQLFHEEVHGAQLSLCTELEQWMQGKVLLSIGPTPKKLSITMYMNRASEIAWLLLRSLPYLQVEDNAFGDRWQEKHKILDDSFLYMQKGLSGLGKEIGDAFITLVEKKFSFDETFYYFEADGSK